MTAAAAHSHDVRVLAAHLQLDDAQLSVLLDGAVGENHAALVHVEVIAKAVDGLNMWQRAYVRQARKDGASWQDVALALGVSRQAAQQRFRFLSD